jgi:hypothetical protein
MGTAPGARAPVTTRSAEPDDTPFIALAGFAACPIVTGNARHLPKATGVVVLSPAECLKRVLAQEG